MRYILIIILLTSVTVVALAQDEWNQWQMDYNTWQINQIRNTQRLQEAREYNAEYYMYMEQNRERLRKIVEAQKDIERTLRELERDGYKWDDKEVE